MKKFMDEDFLLYNETAVKLYHEHAKNMPIIDYHCHLNPKEIAENKRYRNVTEIWLGGDHYKWKAMRSNGIDEKYITGDAEDKEKFLKWAETVPYTVGNPLYHWTHLELKRYFGIDTLLSPQTAEGIWEKCNELLQKEAFTARELIKRSNVKVICTTDDPVDTLEYHKKIAADETFDVKVLPAFRPDKAVNIDKEDFVVWIEKLENVVGRKITTFENLLAALGERVEFFHHLGCRASDHALDPIVFETGTIEEVNEIFKKALAGESLNELEVKKYKTQVLLFLGKKYAKLGWVMQLHIGTIRNVNTRMLKMLGPDTGFDTIGDYIFAQSLANFLNALDCEDELPKTILYCLNPRDNEVLATMIGSFQGGGIPGKIQFGSGWWFNDQKDGMIRQMIALSNVGLLSRFVGMLTDSRSFLSYTRHEYFRRILCNLIGEWVENGEAPDDLDLLGKIVEDICYHNTNQYFGFKQ
ncbi:glucuronate isomerase [Geosporobacter ferrireducens]|uniref:Uronate isomerase n=1 Tax=Geosporobacter ferrireducens TaxID=1424294 RepID=A0A1D8GCF1_9FIRM|nr:glucuronate isomerase [Geosporobacter ferrireducens]AOT68572.1 glucuronate isomerase [Geosporobacter ferrireducens]MTI54040.1 glucuronate isomerase [Geosporobacter ferrireducens]